MKLGLFVGLAATAMAGVPACGDNVEGEDRQGGATTVDDRSMLAYTHVAPNLSQIDQDTFQAGTGPFDFHWEIPQLGPLYNNDSCFGCHGSNGRGMSQIGAAGALTDINGPQSEALVRCSVPTGTPGSPGGPIPCPDLGLQLHDHATTGSAPIVATLSWVEHGDMYGDGTPFSLRAPSIDIRVIATGGSLPNGTMTSYRQAPPVFGMGLLEAIDDSTLLALEDPDDADGDGISGHVNMVWNPISMQTEVGKFGWKANVSALTVQASGAAVNDIGLSNEYFPSTMGDNDVSNSQMDQMVFMVSTIAVPIAAPRSAAAWRGRLDFDSFRCSACHIPTLVTGEASIAALAHQTIHPYTDLLLHDMGDLLTDGRDDFQAQGSEWRTPALWGIGLAQSVQPGVTFLHDGRARTLEEAILWHGGEAMAAREAFRTAAQADRDALIAFLMTL